MASSKGLPAALHLELKEYSSLLRTIRTYSALDFVPQLGRPQSSLDDNNVENEDDDALNHEGSQQDHLANSAGHSKSVESKGKAKKTSRPGKRKRVDTEDSDTWTCWPLLLQHCAVPEWGLDEEVKAIAENYLRTHQSSHAALASSHVQLDSERTPVEQDDDQPALSSAYLSGLISDVSSKLSSLLSLLALHRANVNFTKHARVDPIKWEDVLEVAGVTGLFDKRVVEDAMERMEELLGPSGSEVIQQMQVLENSMRALESAHAEFGEGVTTFVGPPPPKKSRRRKRKHETDESASENNAEEKLAEEF